MIDGKRSFFHRIVLPVLIVSLSLGGRVVAQGNTNAVTEFKGAVKSATPRGLIVTRDDGTEINVMLPDEAPSLQFIANVKPAFLSKGAFVRFNGTFMANGQATEPIKRVEFFQPVSMKQLNGHQKERFTAGIHVDRHADDGSPIAKALVVGMLVGITDDAIMVQAGKVPLQVPLAADVKLVLNINNLSMVQEGDPVKVSGFYQPPNETLVKADTIMISPTRVYGDGDDAKPKRKTRAELAAERAAEKAAKTQSAKTAEIPARKRRRGGRVVIARANTHSFGTRRRSRIRCRCGR